MAQAKTCLGGRHIPYNLCNKHLQTSEGNYYQFFFFYIMKNPPFFPILYKHKYQLPQTNERSLPFSGVFPMVTDDQCGTFMVMNKVPDDQPTCFRIL